MVNERLRAAMLERGATPYDLAKAAEVDPKTAERWVAGGKRRPHKRHRYLVAKFLEEAEDYLWPGALDQGQIAGASESELVAFFPHRWAVPRDVWLRLFSTAEESIDILVIAGLWLAEDAGLVALLRERVEDGVEIRLLVAEPGSAELATREVDENIVGTLPARVRNVLALFKPLTDMDGVELRYHSTTLYNSIFKGDNEVVVNTHVYGVPVSRAPVMHLRRVDGGELVATYLASFEQVWAGARPATTEG